MPELFMSRLTSLFVARTSSRRVSKRLQSAAYGVIESLERRVLMSTNILVTGITDGAGTLTPEGGSNYDDTTLRGAINFAHTNGGSNTISFLSSLTGTISLSSANGPLILSQTNTKIQGLVGGGGTNVLSISGQNLITVFEIDQGVTASIDNLDVINGFTYDNGGGILNDLGTLTLSQCAISDCTADVGGGIANDGGTLTLNQCTISGDSTVNPNAPFGATGVYNGGGIYNSGKLSITGGTIGTITGSTTSTTDSAYSNGGGIFNSSSGNATLTNCAINGDSAGQTYEEGLGGGIYSIGTLTLFGCNVTYDTVNNSGGGIYAAGELTINGGQIQYDTAQFSGGGICNGYSDRSVNANIYGSPAYGSCNISSDSALEGAGGGIANFDGTLSLSQCTISGDHAESSGGGIYNAGKITSISNGSQIISDVAGFSSTTTPGNGSGGGIFNTGAMPSIMDSTISYDLAGSASGGGGGLR